MVSLFEWQQQQKSLKDAERKRVQRANSFMHKYRGGVHDIKHQRQQQLLRETHRERRNRASLARKKYRGGLVDIKHQQDLKKAREFDRERRKRASIAKHMFRGGDHLIEQSQQQKFAKDAELLEKKNTSQMLRSYQGGEHDIKTYERDIMQAKQRTKDALKSKDRTMRRLFPGDNNPSSLPTTAGTISVVARAAELNNQAHYSPTTTQIPSGRDKKYSPKTPRTKMTRTTTSPTVNSPTTTEIPMGSNHDDYSPYSPTSSRKSLSLKSIISFSSSHILEATDDSQADTDMQGNAVEIALEEGLRESSSPLDKRDSNNSDVSNDHETEEFHDPISLVPTLGDDTHNSVGILENVNDMSSSSSFEEKQNDSIAFDPTVGYGNNNESIGILLQPLESTFSGDDQSNYYDWTAVRRNADIDYSHDCSATFQDGSDTLASKSFCSNNASGSEEEKDYYDWGTVESNRIRCEDEELVARNCFERNENQNNHHPDDNCTTSLSSDKESTHVSDRSSLEEMLQEGVFSDSSYHPSQQTSEMEDWMDETANMSRKSSSETTTTTLDSKVRKRFLSLRGIMFNSNCLSPFSANEGGPFFDAKEEVTAKDADLEEWKKTVRFVEHNDNVLEWRNTPHSCSKVLDIYHESTDAIHSDIMYPHRINASRAEFYRTLYTDESEEKDCGYDSDDESNPDDRVLRSFLTNLGYAAISVVMSWFIKFFGMAQKDTIRASTTVLVEEMAEASHAVELVAESATASATMTTSTSASATGSSVAALTTSSSASATGSSVAALTTSTSASATGSSVAASALLSTTVGQGTAIVAQNAILQTMAISAAGTASSSVAGASSAVAVVAGATTVTATATVSTATTVAATTAALGVVAVSTGAVIANTLPADCRENPVNTMARVKISFPVVSENSLATGVFEGRMDWKELGNQIVNAYNNVSSYCEETHQREMLNCTYQDHEFYSFDGDEMMIDTYWEPTVICNGLCPILDPLFGVDVLNPVTNLSQGLGPDFQQKKQLGQEVSIEQEIPTAFPTSEPNKIPINRTEFLNIIGAANIDPMSGKNFTLGDLPSVSFELDVSSRDSFFIPTIEQISVEATVFIMEQDILLRRLAPYQDPGDDRGTFELKVSTNAENNSRNIRSNETSATSAFIEVTADIDPSSTKYSECAIVDTDPTILSRQFEDFFLIRGFGVSVTVLNVQLNSMRCTDSLSSVEAPSPIPDNSISNPLVSGPPIGERQLSGTNLFDSEDHWESVTRDHKYDEDFEVLEYLNVVSRMKKGHSILSDIFQGTSHNNSLISNGANQKKERVVVAYSAPTSLDQSIGKNAMYFKNFHYFLDHAIDCKKHSTVIVATRVVVNEYRSRIEEMNDTLCRSSQFTIELLEREDKCYDMESMATFLRETDSSDYDYFLYINCGVVGPKTKGEDHWTKIFTSRLSPAVKLTGVSINMSFYPHVQSFVLATDTIGIEIIKKSHSIYDCGVKNDRSMTDDERWKIIQTYEIGMSRAIIDAGYSIQSLTGSFGDPISINNHGIQEIIRRSHDHAVSAPLISASESNIWDSNSASLLFPLGDDIWNSNTIRTIGKGRFPEWSDFVFFKASRGILLPEILDEVEYDDQSISLVKDLNDSLPNYEDSMEDICAEATLDFREASKLSVIVTGFQHSGTTMLAQLIKSAPGLFGGFECGILSRVQSPALYDWLLWSMQDDLWGLSSKSRELVVNAKCPAEAYRRLQRYSPLFHFTPNQNSTIVDKYPGYLMHLVKIMDQTPGVPVVIAEKSLSLQIASYKKRGIPDEEINSKVSRLSNAIDEAMKKYPGRIHIANTTRWHEYPDEVMGGVFDFLGLEWRSEYLTMNALNSKRIPGSVFSKPFDTSRAKNLKNVS